MKETSKNILTVVFIVAVIAMLIIANVAPAEVRFWFGFFPMGIVGSIIIGAFIGGAIDALGRWGTMLLIVAAALLLVGTQIASQDLASKADDLKGNYDTWYPLMRGIIWWICSLVPMVSATISVWGRSSQKKV
jgi:hypothetical protein